MLTLSAIRASGFSLVPIPECPTPTVKFSGNGDAEAVSPLDRFLKLLHKNLLDDESTEVGWFDAADLPPMRAELRARIEAAVSGEQAARFVG